MDPDSKKFGRGLRELTGAQDLISHYKLLPHHEFFCKRAHPMLVIDTHYLYNVVGDTKIRKGEGMQLNQLVQDTLSKDTNACIQPFKLDVLREAFHLRETASVYLSPARNVSPKVAGKRKSESKDEHKYRKDRDNENSREHKKHRHRGKDKEKEMNKDKTGGT